jgi:prepilin-type N-terminal cleavage/methylation domain-containing protein
MSHTRRGFTLVELLVVMFFLAIVISILLPVLSTARKHALEKMASSPLHEAAGYAVAMENVR